jgi:integrase
MQDVTGLTIHKYKTWRRSVNDINRVTLQTQLDTLRVYLRFCVRIETVEENLPDKVDSIALSKGEDARDVMLEAEYASEMLEYLNKYRYASLPHALLLTMWHTGARAGALRGLDVGDVNTAENYLELRHRPHTDTPLKNQEGGERDVAIKPRVATVLTDFINANREDYVEESGREPLFTSRTGRLTQGTIRKNAYAWTRPCKIGHDCPHGRDIDTCDATTWNEAYECPSSLSSHPFRRGAITTWLRSNVDEITVSGRMDVSTKVIENHYDERSMSEKMESRRRFLDQVED